MTIKQVVKKLKEDARVVKLETLFFESAAYDFDIKRLMDEVKSIHKLRRSRKLALDPENVNNVKAISEAVLMDQGNRSRLAEIQITALQAGRTLAKALKRLEQYILLEHRETLAMVRTKEERLMVVRRALDQLYEFVEECALLEDMALVVIEDVDRAHWSMKALSDANNMYKTPERRL